MKKIHLKIIFITIGLIIGLTLSLGLFYPSTQTTLEQKEIKNPFIN